MSKVYLNNGVYFCTRITGPTHHLLGLKLSEVPHEQILISAKEVEQISKDLKEEEILHSVQKGLKEGNNRFSSSWHVREIIYDAGDSPHYEVYEDLAKEIVSAIQNNEVVATVKEK